MRYTEKIRKREFETPFDYLRGILEAILLAPYRLTREISLKLPYLPAKKVETFFTISFLIGAVVTVVNFILQYRKGISSLWYSRLPMIVPLVGLGLLAVLLFVVSGMCNKQNQVTCVERKVAPTKLTGQEAQSQTGQADSPNWESMLGEVEDTAIAEEGREDATQTVQASQTIQASQTTEKIEASVVGEDEADIPDEFNLMFSPEVLESYDIYGDLDLSM